MKKILNILGIIICLFLLILVRKYESSLFYDPFLVFFKQADFNHLAPPEFKTGKLIFSLFFRFGLNSLLTLTIIQLWFNNKGITKLTLYILLCCFAVFTLLYIVSILTGFGLGYMPTFYIRRILIQPIIVLLLIPAIYYYRYSKN